MSYSTKTYAEQLEELVAGYKERTGQESVNLSDAAIDAISRGEWKPYPQDVVKLLSNQMARALRSIHSVDPKGRTVRKHHAIPIRKDNQTTFQWFEAQDLSYREMKASAQYRRSLVLHDCRQLKNDVDSWNDFYSDGQLVQVDFNFTPDMLDSELPDTHPDINLSEGDDDDVL